MASSIALINKVLLTDFIESGFIMYFIMNFI